MPDERWILLPCKAKNRRNPDGFQEFLTQQGNERPVQTAFNGCEYRFLRRDKTTFGIVDAQSVQNADTAEEKGYDAGKKYPESNAISL